MKPTKGHQTLQCNSFCLILTMRTTNHEGIASPYQPISSVLNSSKLQISAHHKQLIKAAISEINYDNIAKKIKSIFSSEIETCKQNNIELNIKDEPTYYTKETTSEEEVYENDNESHNELCDTYYT